MFRSVVDTLVGGWVHIHVMFSYIDSLTLFLTERESNQFYFKWSDPHL